MRRSLPSTDGELRPAHPGARRGFLLDLFAFAKDDEAWWARLLIQPPAVWLLLGVLSGATIGFMYARRDRPEGLPLRPDAA
jgi:hypothetical protein